MKRYSLIGRLGPDDSARVDVIQRDSERFEIDFLNADRRLDFGLGQALEQLSGMGLNPSEVAVDLAILAAMVNAADTRISRDLNAQDRWTREIDLYIPVSDVTLWNGEPDALGAMLRFLTGDRWRVLFRARPRRVRTIVNTSDRLPLEGLGEVCLFSGGLDSLIGALDLLKEGRRPLLVSHYWDAETSKAQTWLLEKLSGKFPKPEIKSVRVRLGFDRNHLNTMQTEETQRGRSFLFFALAALAASSVGEDVRINVPENGLIALNVPLDPLRFGALSTRTAHPHFIASMNGLLQRLGNLGRLQNRYRHQTKGEMVAGCKDMAFLQKEVANSMSCSSPAKARYRGLSPRHCGYCVPCLIRRASLEAGLGKADPTLYTIPDLKAAPIDTTKADGEHIRSFQLMAKRMAASTDLARILIHKPGPLPRDERELEGFAGVFRRGVSEVANLLEGVRAKPN